jgi:hypothetical protein
MKKLDPSASRYKAQLMSYPQGRTKGVDRIVDNIKDQPKTAPMQKHEGRFEKPSEREGEERSSLVRSVSDTCASDSQHMAPNNLCCKCEKKI